jgi:hypothetical protein
MEMLGRSWQNSTFEQEESASEEGKRGEKTASPVKV